MSSNFILYFPLFYFNFLSHTVSPLPHVYSLKCHEPAYAIMWLIKCEIFLHFYTTPNVGYIFRANSEYNSAFAVKKSPAVDII